MQETRPTALVSELEWFHAMLICRTFTFVCYVFHIVSRQGDGSCDSH
jgi:hypothetical protein